MLIRTTMRPAQACLRARAASDGSLVAKKGATSITSSKPHYAAKYARKLFQLQVQTTNLFHHLRQEHTLMSTVSLRRRRY